MNLGIISGKCKRQKVGHRAEKVIEGVLNCETCGGSYENINENVHLNFPGIDHRCRDCGEVLQCKAKHIIGDKYPIVNGHWNHIVVPASKHTLSETISSYANKIRFCYLFYRKTKDGICVVDSIAITERLSFKNIAKNKSSIISNKACWVDIL
jgi:hypothetical protein